MFSRCSIVLLGNFNPAIFHPEWFDRFKILPIQEVQWAEGKKAQRTTIPYKKGQIVIEEVPPLIVKPDLADLHFASLRVKVDLKRYECFSDKSESFSYIKEVTIKIFTLLKHTPIKSLGINFLGHWKLKDDSDLILKNLFGGREGALKDALGENYQVTGQLFSNEQDRKIRLKFEPSRRIDKGIFFDVNCHRDIESGQAEQAIEYLRDNYKKDREDVVKIIKKLIGDPEEIWTIEKQEK